MFSKLNKSGISISDRQPHKCLLSVSEPFPLPLLNVCLLRRVQQGRYCKISATEHYNTLRFFI